VSVLNREQFAKPLDRYYEEHEFPPHDPAKSTEPTKVRLRKMYIGEYIALENSCSDDAGNVIKERALHFWELATAFCLVDENGKRFVSDTEVLDKHGWWKKQDSGFMRPLIRHVRRMHDEYDTGDVGEQAKNSLEIDDLDSNSESPND